MTQLRLIILILLILTMSTTANAGEKFDLSLPSLFGVKIGMSIKTAEKTLNEAIANSIRTDEKGMGSYISPHKDLYLTFFNGKVVEMSGTTYASSTKYSNLQEIHNYLYKLFGFPDAIVDLYKDMVKNGEKNHNILREHEWLFWGVDTRTMKKIHRNYYERYPYPNIQNGLFRLEISRADKYKDWKIHLSIYNNQYAISH